MIRHMLTRTDLHRERQHRSIPTCTHPRAHEVVDLSRTHLTHLGPTHRAEPRIAAPAKA